jgi:tripartite-type tricarboxylate transporter receptor subunit TctC
MVATRRRLLAAGLAAPLTLPALAQGQADWPNRPVRVVLPYSAGGPTDIICRLVCDQLSQRLPQRFVVENRTGAGSTIGAGAVAKAAPDGYTLLFSNIGHAVLRSLYVSLDFDPVSDFRAVTIVAESPMVLLVPPNSPWRSLADFVAEVRAHPGKHSYVSSGGGGALQLVTLLFLKAAGLQMEEIAYRGSAPAVPDLAAGSVDMMYDAGATGFQLAKNGQARALAVSSAQRSPVMPDVPTMAEAGFPTATFAVWQLLMAPALTPDAIVTRLQREVAAVLADPAIRARLAELGAERVIGNTPDEAQAFVAAEAEKWAVILRDAGVRPQ